MLRTTIVVLYGPQPEQRVRLVTSITLFRPMQGEQLIVYHMQKQIIGRVKAIATTYDGDDSQQRITIGLDYATVRIADAPGAPHIDAIEA